MSLPIPARPTTYRGIAMRSRLEATFAAGLDKEGTVWEYEPRCYANQHGQYLPDFLIKEIAGKPLDVPVFLEVRPTLDRAYLAMVQMTVVWDSEPGAELIIAVPGECWFYADPADRTWRLAA